MVSKNTPSAPTSRTVKRRTTAQEQETTTPSSNRAKRTRQTKTKSFQIRTRPEIFVLAERAANEHGLPRSKVDNDIYEQGLYIKMSLMGPDQDGTYAGLTEQELAQRLATTFPLQYALLDKHGLLPPFMYRVISPGGMIAMPLGTTLPATSPLPVSEPKEANSEYKLDTNATVALNDFPEEI